MTAYREIGVLAEGGMAVVAQAERDDGCTVVIKRVRPPFCFDASFLRLFADEGAVHAALDDENIVRLLDRGEDEAGPFLVFEHVDGTDLAIVLEHAWAEQRGLDVECVLAVAIPLFKALAAAHEAKDVAGAPLMIVHRDVSPGNVLIAADGAVKLADFGVASFTLKSEATVAGEMKGKFAYMAPEQTRGEKVGPRADLFSAGVVLWEALAGKRLFDGPTDADVVAAVRQQPAPALSGPLAPLVAQLLEKDPAARPSSAREVVGKLQALALELGLDEGLARHAARLARTAPRREVQVREMDARRRTQRVLDTSATAVVVVERKARVLPLLPYAAAAVVVVVAAVAWASRPDDVVQLPDAPAPLAPAPIAHAPAPLTPAPNAPAPAPAPAPVTSAPPTTHASTAHATVATTHAATHAPLASPVGAALSHVTPVEGFGKLTITAEPWATVTVDGKVAVKETPLRAYTVPAGPHTVVLENPVLKLKKTVTVDVPADGEVRKFYDLNAP